jgi:two-component system sensor histidine kinase PilS (NtrC family)
MATTNKESKRRRISALIFFRVIFVSLLLGSSFVFKGFERLPTYKLISYLIVALYVLTILYLLLLKKVKNFFKFAYTQLIVDVFFAITLIYLTGGIDSWFSFTLLLIIISSAIVLNKKAGYIIASLNSILYGTLINLQFYNILPVLSGEYIKSEEYLHNIFIHIISFYVTAFLSGYLSSRLEKTERELEEKDIDLRNLEVFNKEVIESMKSGLFTTDMSGKVLIFNPSAEKITGVKAEQIVGKKIDSVIPYFKFPFSEHIINQEIKVKNGSEKIIGLGISLLKDSLGNTKGYIGIFQDLTHVKKLEEEMKNKEKLAVIGELSSSIAHEIRNPLASLKGSIELLKNDNIPDENRKKLMEIAVSEMDRLNRVITDFLAYSKPSPCDFVRFDLHVLIDDIVELLKNVKKEEDNIKIVKDYNGEFLIRADPQKLRQVLWNLGINAIEAMSQIGGELVISTRDRDDKIMIIVKDTGIGIKDEDKPKIFYPFYTTKDNGTGLGLAIAHRIVEEHGGSLVVDSRYGFGTTFEIILKKNYEKP